MIDRKATNKMGSRQGPREQSAGFGYQDSQNNQNVLYDSEGEIGDHIKFAERANGKG